LGYVRGATHDTLRRRAGILAAIREFFAARTVLEVETPALSAAAISDPAIDSIRARVLGLRPSQQYLHTSPEFAMKRLLADGLGDIYQICRVFRDGELGRWHQPEFTLLEWYRLGWNELQLMDEVAALINVVLAIQDEPRPSLHVTYADAFAHALKVDLHAGMAAIGDAISGLGIDIPGGLDRDGLLDLAFSTAVAPGFDPHALTFVTDYPATQAALAELKPGHPPVAARFEVFCAGLELCNGFRELTDTAEQRRRFATDLQKRAAANRPIAPLDEDFLAALATLPPCSGVAVGIDRLIAVASGMPSLAQSMSFAHE
jgi:lysyl-tRNA synthetase class 2